MNAKILERINQFKRSLWLDTEIKEWYGVDIFDDTSFLNNFVSWASLYQKTLYKISTVNYAKWKTNWDIEHIKTLPEIERIITTFKLNSRLEEEPNLETVIEQGKLRWINRYFLELFFQQNNLIPIRHAAIQWGMDVDTFVKIIMNNYPLHCSIEPYPKIYSINDLNGLWLELKKRYNYNKCIGDYNTFLSKLHEFINKDIPVSPIYCKTSERLDSLTLFATEYDILTNDPMNMKYRVVFNNGKPMKLMPDFFSWQTCVRYNIPSQDILGGIEEITDQIREKLL